MNRAGWTLIAFSAAWAVLWVAAWGAPAGPVFTGSLVAAFALWLGVSVPRGASALGGIILMLSVIVMAAWPPAALWWLS